MEVIDKPWGQIFRLWDTAELRIEPIEILKGGYSSEHCHARQDNLFILVDGRVDIRIFAEGSKPGEKWVDVFSLSRSWQSRLVPAGVWHQFYCHDPSKLVEVYFPAEIDASDIKRRSQNGVESPSVKGDGFVMSGQRDYILD